MLSSLVEGNSIRSTARILNSDKKTIMKMLVWAGQRALEIHDREIQETMWNRAIMISIYGPDDLFTLKKIVEEFRDDLLKTGKMSNIMWWGIPDREFSIEISPEDLIRYKLTVGDISEAVRNSSLNLSSGSVLTDQEEILSVPMKKNTKLLTSKVSKLFLQSMAEKFFSGTFVM